MGNSGLFRSEEKIWDFLAKFPTFLTDSECFVSLGCHRPP